MGGCGGSFSMLLLWYIVLVGDTRGGGWGNFSSVSRVT